MLYSFLKNIYLLTLEYCFSLTSMWSTQCVKRVIAKLILSCHSTMQFKISFWQYSKFSKAFFFYSSSVFTLIFILSIFYYPRQQDNQNSLYCLVKDAVYINTTSRTERAGQMPPVFCCPCFVCFF